MPISHQVLADGFPPKANAAWIYDPKAGDGSGAALALGHFAQALVRYNRDAEPDARIRQFYVYGGDLEMYCPRHQVERCTSKDFHVYYSHAAQHGSAPTSGTATNDSVRTYAERFRSARFPGEQTALIVPVIDGVISGHGMLRGFNDLSRAQASAFADKVAQQVCASGEAAGVQFDLEPFDVAERNGQYYFYLRIAQDFASRTMGCVDRNNPRGRFFSIFTVANRIRSGTPGARHVQEIMREGNGYLIDALYDLLGTPPGQQTPIEDYRRLVIRETRNMRTWAGQIRVKYEFGIPAAAGAHEFVSCTGPACGEARTDASDSRPVTQLDYVEAAISAIRDSGAPGDPLYLGAALWAWSPGLDYRGMRISPAVPPEPVLRFLSGNLCACTGGGAGPTCRSGCGAAASD